MEPQAVEEGNDDVPGENQVNENINDGNDEDEGEQVEEAEPPGSPCYPFASVSTALLYTWDAMNRSSKEVLQSLLDILHRPDFTPSQCPKTVSNL